MFVNTGYVSFNTARPDEVNTCFKQYLNFGSDVLGRKIISLEYGLHQVRLDVSSRIIDSSLPISVGNNQNPRVVPINVRLIGQDGLVYKGLISTLAFSFGQRCSIQEFILVTSLAFGASFFHTRPASLVTLFAKHRSLCIMHNVILYRHMFIIITKFVASLVLGVEDVSVFAQQWSLGTVQLKLTLESIRSCAYFAHACLFV